MTNFEDVINAEKQRKYQADDPDLMAFATLTQIAHEQAQSRIKRRFKASIILALICSLLAIQFITINAHSFTELARLLTSLVQQKPQLIAIANLSCVGIILLARKLKFF